MPVARTIRVALVVALAACVIPSPASAAPRGPDGLLGPPSLTRGRVPAGATVRRVLPETAGGVADRMPLALRRSSERCHRVRAEREWVLRA